MKKEFNEAVEWIRKSLSFNRVGVVSVFETTIRELGGLLAAYDLSGEKILLEKAEDLGSRLIHAFDGGIGIPRSQVDLSKRAASTGWSGNSAILAELGTLQVEFRYLSHATTNPSYEDISMEAIKLMAAKNPPHGLYPIKVGFSRGEFTDSTVTFGALGDSFYEYLLKLWLQGNREEMWLRNMYDRAIDGVIKILLKASSKTGLAFLSDWNGARNDLKMDHLVCFMPGIMTLGAYTDPSGLDSERAQRDLNVAKALMFTCREMYHRTKSGIAPEFVRFDSNDMNTRTTAPFYILRPETAESLYVMSHLTGDPIYRDWAWEIWTAIDQNCRVGSGFASLRDVNAPRGGGLDDRMESFFLAETMKYLYLAQDPDSEINLMDYVFNTEAHPTKIFKKGTHQATQMK